MPQIVVRLPPDLIAELERAAKGDGRTLAALVRLILTRWIPEPSRGAWPVACIKPGSCSRHRACMYTACVHADRDIAAEVEAETARRSAIDAARAVRP